ncbi:hypothetical protein CIG75_03165 [Tumebacillus algifaecis]|uniref:Uncharacterized protein n=1 Tax=Tumebacillus algifaecis TaxID=1214604 RepID=A0A223CXQ8_9BACL|nr:hypothetical protein [Tumebacillus algifaecis]ASS74082.1 hypothetical protein CIG75_03165 [Tumebacillus algifaecis]
MKLEENKEKLAIGDVTIQMYKVDGTILQEQELRNLIVKSASVLMARRMAPSDNAATYNGTFQNHVANGFQYLALGKGVGTGNLQAPQAENPDLAGLRDEVYRKKISSWRFLNSDGTASTAPTNILELTTEITEAEAIPDGQNNVPLTEMGLFGGDATDSKGTGFLFNHKVFPVWNKPNDARLRIIWKITF